MGELAERILNDQKWQALDQPFRHIIVDNLFPQEIYSKLVADFQRKLQQGLSEEYSKEQFYRQGHYDAYAWILDPKFSEAWNFFYSRAWYERLKQEFKLPLLPNTRAAFHHHRPLGKRGTIHTDYNIANFVQEPLPNGINPWFHQCVYMRARVVHPAVTQNVRSVAILFYFENADPWTRQEGGATGIYALKDGQPELTKRVAPKNNRALIFEVSPISYHSYLRNGPSPRNCLAQWFHIDENEAQNLYGTLAEGSVE